MSVSLCQAVHLYVHLAIIACNRMRFDRARVETTALGAACLAGLATGFWKDTRELEKQWQMQREFRPAMDKAKAAELKNRWRKAVSCAKGWLKD